MKHWLVFGTKSKDIQYLRPPCPYRDFKISLESFDLMIDQIEVKKDSEINWHQCNIYEINKKHICEDFFVHTKM